MAYIIAEPCIGTKDTACVDVCPVDCGASIPGRWDTAFRRQITDRPLPRAHPRSDLLVLNS